MTDLPPSLFLDYSHAYWKNGFRRNVDDRALAPLPDLLCFETGTFGWEIDLADLSSARFGFFDSNDLGYVDCLSRENRARMEDLEDTQFVIRLTVDGRVGRAVSCQAALVDNDVTPFNSTVLLWESGKLIQHFTLKGLKLLDDDDAPFECTADLDIMVWPDAITLTLSVSPPEGVEWSDVTVVLRLREWRVEQPIALDSSALGDPRIAILHCDTDAQRRQTILDSTRVDVTTNDVAVPVVVDDPFHCHVAQVEYGDSPPKYARTFQRGYTDVREYDEFIVKVTNVSSEILYVPFLLYVLGPANVTGLCPIVCTPEGVPTGIPVQLSKNWHFAQLGEYFRSFFLLPVPAMGTVSYLIRVVYGFYGQLPSASHAHLTLVGCQQYSGRWEQLAIGCFGEIMCLDPEMSWVTNTVTDIRGLMLRNGASGNKWGWTDCSWGGDWLYVRDPTTDHQLSIVDMKTAYVSHGPCLTDVRYAGSYGDDRQVDYDVQVRTLRTDDYARTFHTIKYQFSATVNVDGGWLFMSRTRGFIAPTFAYGNLGGLIEEQKIPNGLEPDDAIVTDTVVQGDAPYWFSFPDSYQYETRDWGTGTKHWVVRSYRADISGTIHSNPTLSCVVFETLDSEKLPCLEMRLRPPEGVNEFHEGDSIELEVEWMTTPKEADDYYGPNVLFQDFLTENPKSWKIPFREASGNVLDVQVEGGTVDHKYPLRILVVGTQVDFTIQGGVGAVPVEFVGLPSISFTLYQIVGGTERKVDQSRESNDFWQTDYDARVGTFSLSYNLPLDGLESSEWSLKPSDEV